MSLSSDIQGGLAEIEREIEGSGEDINIIISGLTMPATRSGERRGVTLEVGGCTARVELSVRIRKEMITEAELLASSTVILASSATVTASHVGGNIEPGKRATWNSQEEYHILAREDFIGHWRLDLGSIHQ